MGSRTPPLFSFPSIPEIRTDSAPFSFLFLRGVTGSTGFPSSLADERPGTFFPAFHRISRIPPFFFPQFKKIFFNLVPPSLPVKHVSFATVFLVKVSMPLTDSFPSPYIKPEKRWVVVFFGPRDAPSRFSLFVVYEALTPFLQSKAGRTLQSFLFLESQPLAFLPPQENPPPQQPLNHKNPPPKKNHNTPKFLFLERNKRVAFLFFASDNVPLPPPLCDCRAGLSSSDTELSSFLHSCSLSRLFFLCGPQRRAAFFFSSP